MQPHPLRRVSVLCLALCLCTGLWLSAAVPEALQKHLGRRLESVQISLVRTEGVRQVLIAQGFMTELFGLFPDYTDDAEHRAELDAFIRAAIAKNPVTIENAGEVVRCALPDAALLAAPAILPGDAEEASLRTFAAYIEAANQARWKGLLPLDNDYWHGDSATHFKAVDERAPYLVRIQDGPLWSGGLPLTGETSKDSKGLLNFVLSPELELYAGPLVPGRFHHSSFLAGGPLVAAGEFTMDQGRIKTITNRSGHYKPSAAILLRFLRFLNAKGVDLADTKIDMVGVPVVSAKTFMIGGDPEVHKLQDVLKSGRIERLRQFLAGVPLPLSFPYFLEDGEQETILHMACDAKASPEALRLILERGSEVNLPDSRGRTPIGILLTHRPVPVAQAEVLLGAHADVGILHGRGRRDVVLELLLGSQRELYESICKRTDHVVNSDSINRISASEPENRFHLYLERGRTDPATLAELLRLGADVNLPIGGPARGFGPLHLAAMRGDLAALRLMLEARGADVNALGGLLARPPLDYARQCGRTEAAAFLLTKGALTVEQLRPHAAAPPAGP